MIGLRQFIRHCFQHALLLALIASCSKVEEPFPEVSFTYVDGRVINYGDTLRLGFESTNASSYKLSLVQGARLFTVSQRQVFREGNTFDLELIFNDPYLESGNYELRLQVENSEKGASAFSSIRYIGLALAQEGFALLGERDLELIDNAQNRTLFPLLNPFDALKVSSRDSLIYLAAFADAQTEVRRLGDFQLVRTLPMVAPTGSRSYFDFIKSEQGLYLLRSDGGVDYLEEGTLQASTTLPNGRIARTGCILNAKLVTISYDAAGLNPQLKFYNANLNGSFQSYPLPGSNHIIFPLQSNQELALLLQRNAQWELHIYNSVNQTLSLEYIGNNQMPVAGSATAQSQVLMFSTDQELYRAFISGSNVPMVIQSGAYNNFQLSRFDQGLYLKKANTVFRLGLDNNLQFAASKFDVLQDYDIRYNK